MTALEVIDIRRAAGLTQTELAALLAVSPRTIQSWEQGRRRPGGPAAKLLANLAQKGQNRVSGGKS